MRHEHKKSGATLRQRRAKFIATRSEAELQAHQQRSALVLHAIVARQRHRAERRLEARLGKQADIVGNLVAEAGKLPPAKRRRRVTIVSNVDHASAGAEIG